MRRSAIRFGGGLAAAGALLWTATARAQSGGMEMMGSFDRTAPLVRERLIEVLRESGNFLHSAGETLGQASPTGDAMWHLGVLLWSFVFMAVGAAAAYWQDRWGRKHFMHLFNPQPQSRAEKIGYLWTSAVLRSLLVVTFVVVSIVVTMALTGNHKEARHSHMIQILAVGLVWEAWILLDSLLATNAPSHRMLAIGDTAARRLHRNTIVAFAITTFILAMCAWMDSLGLSQDAHLLALIGGSLVAAILLSVLSFVHRDDVGGMILGARAAEAGALVTLVAKIWPVLATGYFFVAWAISSVRLLLDKPSALGLVTEPVTVTFAGIGLYGLLLVIIDKVAERRHTRAEILSEDAEFAPSPSSGALKRLAEKAAALVVFVLGLWVILELWGVDVHSDGPLLRAADVILICFLAYLAFQAIRIVIDEKIEAEGGGVEAEPGDEGGPAGGASRLATLLPIFRNFLLIIIALIAGMIVLSELGVDIGPLFAGAGIVGVAIGFGAQTLIRDIFSGAFFLIDDAFRKGEYINIGSVKGTVENISIRSMQLRHHLGALHTIPFGEIKHLTNYSRDWVIMKLVLRLTYDTDVERVRKLIKKLGAELLEDAEIGDKFMQPLKSQGVYSMEDSAMLIRVKFMTRPGDQFQVRKKVYARIRELFEQNDIHFAHRFVTVRVASEDDDEELGKGEMPRLSEADKKAIAGAALPAIDDAAKPVPATARAHLTNVESFLTDV